MKQYQIIYADPPWRYKENWGNGTNEHTYKTMRFEEIRSLPIKDIVSDEAHLYLWVTNPFLSEGLEICKAWGFDYKTLLTWIKTYTDGSPEMGMGYYFRSCTEHIIFGTRGKMKVRNKITKNMFFAVNPRWLGRSHSAKPDEVRQWIVDWSGDLPRIELFARTKVDGWDCWGNEVEGDIELQAPTNHLYSQPPSSQGIRCGIPSTPYQLALLQIRPTTNQLLCPQNT